MASTRMQSHKSELRFLRSPTFISTQVASPPALDSIPISPWPHQLKILLQVAKEFPRSFLIADEVGLGKTIETGLILRYLLLSKKAQRILVLAPASVQPQWHEELREKFNLHFWSYTQGEFKDPYKNTHSASANPWNTKDLVLASSHLVRRKERMNELLECRTLGLGGTR